MENPDFKQLQVVVFTLGKEYYAVPISQIKEVVATPYITKIPLMPNFVRGVANIRGNVLAMVDLELLLEISKQEDKKNYALVVDSKDYRMAVMVAQVPTALNIDESQIDTQTHLAEESKNYIRGVIKNEDKLIIFIDLFVIMRPELMNEYKLNVQSGVIA